jgi:hypothetical protein
VEALNIATINVVSVSMIVVGGTLYALDVNSIEELQKLVRRGMGTDDISRSEQEAEEEIEEWVASVLDRRAAKEKAKETEQSNTASRRRTTVLDDEKGMEATWQNQKEKRRGDP